MDEITIQQKLDRLAEFHSKAHALELHKRELLDEVKVPAEVEALVVNGMKRQTLLESATREKIATFNSQVDVEMAGIVIPTELKTALAEIDRQRAELMVKLADIEKQRQIFAAKKHANETIANDALIISKRALLVEIQEQTKEVYTQLAQRKNEIETEFSGKANDAEENIRKLEAEIKADMLAHANEKLKANPKCKDLSVKGQFFHAIYGKPRKTWIPAKLEDYVETHPDIKGCYTEGEPSITLRSIH